MLIHELKIAGLLSFGPEGVTVPLRNLNVLIGANGSGKSNFLEVLALLKAAPQNLYEPVNQAGGIHEWLWKGPDQATEATIEAVVIDESGEKNLRHVLVIGEHGERFEVMDERIESTSTTTAQDPSDIFYNYQRGNPLLIDVDSNKNTLQRDDIIPGRSILAQVKEPRRYPELAYLSKRYSDIRLFRNWSFGPTTSIRYSHSLDWSNDFPSDGGDNLALVYSALSTHSKNEVRTALNDLYADIVDISTPFGFGQVQLVVEERGGRRISAARLSDGTLRYLWLLVILLHPTPPPLIAIEEPELGLHPDVLPNLVKLMRQASERTQLVVTTHSEIIVDALSDEPDAVIVCEKVDGRSQFERLDAERLKHWLDRYSLGQLWTKGGIGGNRW